MSRHASLASPLTLTPEGSEKEGDDHEVLDYMDFFCDRVEFPEQTNGLTDVISKCKTELNIIQFDCLGDCNPQNITGKNSYYSASALYNLLCEGHPFTDLSFNSRLKIPAELLYQKLPHYFKIIRKNIHIVEKDCKPLNLKRISVQKKRRKDAFELRKEVVNTLQSLSLLVCELNTENHDQFLQSISSEIKDLFKFLGPLSILPQHVVRASSSSGNACRSPPYHFLHLHLDVRWWSLCLLHQICYKFGDSIGPLSENGIFIQGKNDTNCSKSLLDSCLCVIIWDLINLMEKRSSQVPLSELFSKPSFHCTCMHELAVLVLHLTEWRRKILKKEALWPTVTQKLLEKLMGNNTLPERATDIIYGWHPTTSVQETKNYQIWWIFTSIADLFQYDMDGNATSFGITNSTQIEPKMLRTLILLTIIKPSEGVTSAAPPEDELRLLMTFCHRLLLLWENVKDVKHTNWVNPLWEFFSKRLDSSFMVRGANLQGFASLSKSPAHFINQIKDLNSTSLITKNESSWNIFLRIVVALAKHSESEWKTLKVRIYLKFHSKKMNDLSPTGLYNTAMLFLAIANTKDHLNLGSKLCELLNMVRPGSVQKLYTTILGSLSVCYLLLTKNCNLKEVASEINSKIADIVQRCSAAVDKIERRDIGHSIVIYCEGVQELLSINCTLTLGQEHLFGSSLSVFLSQSTLVERKAILGCLNQTLSKVLEESQDLYSLANGVGLDILDVIWMNFHPYLKTQFRSQSPDALLAPVCASLVLCAARFEDACKELNMRAKEATTLLASVLGAESVSSRATLPFLTHLLRHPTGIEQVSKSYPKYDEKLVVLLLNHLVESGSSEEVIAAADVFLSTPNVDKLLGEGSESPTTRNLPACPFGALEMLIQKVSQSFRDEANFQSRLKIREKANAYFSSLDKALISLLKKDNLPSHTPQILHLVGCIFSHASALLYAKGNATCPLPKLLSAVILPNSVYKMQKPLGQVLTDALWPVLPKVISGLSSLGLDPYVSRCLKDIFVSYIHRFHFSAHPFPIALNAESSPKELRKMFIYAMNLQFISKRHSNVAQLQMVLNFILELLNTVLPLWIELVCETLFSSLLELLLFVVDLSTKRTATELLQKILQEVQSDYTFLRCGMVESVRLFVLDQLAWSSDRVFRILEVIAVTNRDVIADALPGIQAAIESVEFKRGTGTDYKLRNGYLSLAKRVQPGSDNSCSEELTNFPTPEPS